MGGATPPAREPGSSEQTTSRISPERLLAQAGGVSGVIYSSLPVVVFVIVSSVSGLVPAIAAALGVAALVLLWRLIRRDSPQPALSGFFGVALCALIAYVLGESKGYFLLGIWMSLVWAVVVAASVAIRRPLVGYAWSWATGRGDGWRSVPRAVLAFDIASLGWVLVFTSRFVVQGLLYDADRTGWLAAARIGMGWPLTVLAALATYAAIKSAQRAIAAGAELAPRTVGD
ncbi:DUF3159 domain-containing protein [Mycobacterium intracellulare]|uniref:DUF3159 domain-containing protein n=1 Tax=Mycobacterium intracellulare TaxID=1767 RepID=A0AAE4RIY1_MYCIT|nr:MULTISPECIES: DUF3159 domain-containing protein [Mycobacterium]MCA2322654.1 DUF3159 domain-containing protein [Mycobacterium intracellulare]MCA2343759.1 DUF3159 domain-containing protein [Mycobacterium intracellulare]MDV6977979.1 DUF3159 domain-containing protein [Mycobacterium intracellulare]MDV6983393.1 DUF3159 domain-containing protein [Mycobacterium intracellulare]MDV7015978.1 DUF3159 domain-containing protein [Mycobacterium intracellulare]